MNKDKRKGKEVVAEIIPWCQACGELLDIPHSRARHLTQHEPIEVKCEDCGEIARLETEIIYFSRKTAQSRR